MHKELILSAGIVLVLATVACDQGTNRDARHWYDRTNEPGRSAGESQQPAVPAKKATAEPAKNVKAEPNETDEEAARMQALGRKAAGGDLKAVDELQATHMRLYDNIDYHNEKSRVSRNLKLMRAAFNELGKAAGGNGEREPAMRALRYANSKRELRSWTPDAFGIAAGLGNAQALDVLLKYKEHDLLLSSTVFALKHAAEKNNPAAVDFLIGVLDDQSDRALWHGASSELTAPAGMGNERAAEALKRYHERQKSSK